MKHSITACGCMMLTLLAACALNQPGRGGQEQARLELQASDIPVDLAGAMVTGAAASPEGSVFLLDGQHWRIRAHSRDGDFLFELDAPSSLCLIAGGRAQGFCLADDLNRQMACYDQRGKQLWAARYDQHSITAFATAPSGEFYILDGQSGSVAVRNQGFVLVRRWNLSTAGSQLRPEAIAVDQMAGTVVVADPAGKRLAGYSLLGIDLGRTDIPVIRGPQSIAFDRQGNLWVCADDGTVRALRITGRRWHEVGSARTGNLRGVIPGAGDAMLAYTDTSLVSLSIK